MMLIACGSDFQPEGSGGSGGTSSSSGTTTQTGMGGFDGCSSDGECLAGVEWCESGFCVPCDNTGSACDLTCTQGWSLYERNGCQPCDCAPPNDCTVDGQCPSSGPGAGKCYAGNHCWDWCPAGDPSCCFGNQCSMAGCPDPNLAGCMKTGCEPGQQCLNSGCNPTECTCNGTSWECGSDCAGGECSPS
jgi:hypothetical protein